MALPTLASTQGVYSEHKRGCANAAVAATGRNRTMSTIDIRLCIASAALLAGPVSMQPLAATEVPQAVAVHGEVLVTSVNATGVQV